LGVEASRSSPPPLAFVSVVWHSFSAETRVDVISATAYATSPVSNLFSDFPLPPLQRWLQPLPNTASLCVTRQRLGPLDRDFTRIVLGFPQAIIYPPSARMKGISLFKGLRVIGICLPRGPTRTRTLRPCRSFRLLSSPCWLRPVVPFRISGTFPGVSAGINPRRLGDTLRSLVSKTLGLPPSLRLLHGLQLIVSALGLFVPIFNLRFFFDRHPFVLSLTTASVLVCSQSFRSPAPYYAPKSHRLFFPCFPVFLLYALKFLNSDSRMNPPPTHPPTPPPNPPQTTPPPPQTKPPPTPPPSRSPQRRRCATTHQPSLTLLPPPEETLHPPTKECDSPSPSAAYALLWRRVFLGTLTLPVSAQKELFRLTRSPLSIFPPPSLVFPLG